MKIFNLTPHTINVYSESSVSAEFVNNKPTGKFIAKPDAIPVASFPSDGMARCLVNEIRSEGIDGFDFLIVKKTFGEVNGIPADVSSNDCIIVSAIVGTALKSCFKICRVFGPGSIVLKDGQIVGCLGLSEF